MATFKPPPPLHKMVNFRTFRKMLIKNEGSIFFKTDCVKIHKTVSSTTYIKLSKIWRPRLNRSIWNQSWLIWNGSIKHINKKTLHISKALVLWTLLTLLSTNYTDTASKPPEEFFSRNEIMINSCSTHPHPQDYLNKKPENEQTRAMPFIK
jgi:hypothetical protein